MYEYFMPRYSKLQKMKDDCIKVFYFFLKS